MTLKSLPLLALLVAAAPLFAQDAAPEQPAPDQAAPTAPEAAPADGTASEGTTTDGATTDGTPAAPDPAAGGQGTADPGLALGEPVDPATVAVGQPYIRSVFGDWSLRCLKAEGGDDPCQMYQLLTDDQGNAVAEISMFPLPEGGEAAAGATIVAPLETLLTEELTLSVDGGQARRYPFSFCNRAGCVARVGFTAPEVDQFRRGNAALMSIVPAAAPDQVVDLTISLAGFTDAFEAGPTAPAAQ